MKHNCIGAIHIHSTYSDGTKDVEYIIRQAKKTGLKWIILTDHNNLDAKKHEGIHDGVYVIAGCEITPPTANHLLAIGVDDVIDFEIGEKKYIEEVHKQGGICFPAHPDESIHRDNRQSPLRWQDWSIDTFDGLEIWNYLTDWTDSFSVNKSALLQYLNRHRKVSGPTKNVLAWWDRLNNKKEEIVPAIGGIDAHAFKIKKKYCPVKISDYKDFFLAVNNLLILDEPISRDFSEAKKQITDAIKNSNNIIINRKVCKNTNIEFYAATKEKKAFSGEILHGGMYSKLVLNLPQKATVRVIHNGVLVYEKETKILEYDNLDKGKYRIEVFKNGIPWIFTNPVKII